MPPYEIVLFYRHLKKIAKPYIDVKNEVKVKDFDVAKILRVTDRQTED